MTRAGFILQMICLQVLLGSSLALAQALPSTDVLEKYGTPQNGISGEKVETTTPTVQGEPTGEELIYLNTVDADITDIIKQISKATGTNFILDDKIKNKKITIISEKPMNKEMAYQAFLSALEVMGYTTVATPSGLIKIVETKEALTKPLDIYKDETPLTDQFITRIVQVTNISANEISSVIKSLVSKEGNLFAYPATNTLILTDTGSNIDRVLKIIRELDQEGPQEVIEIIPIQNANATDITEKILQLYEQEGAPKGKTTKRGAKGADVELEEVPQISKVISDERTNSIIVLGTKRAITKMRALIARLDTPVTGAEGTIHVYHLKYATAKELSDVLSSLVSGATTKKGAATKEADAKSGSVELEGGVKVTADEGTNSLVITATPKDYETLIEMVVSKLDIPRRQVYLEAVVMELTVNKSRTLGVSGNAGGVFSFLNNNLTAFGAILPLAPNAISGIAQAAGGLAGGAVSEETISFTDSNNETVSIPAISAILQALQVDSDVNILSTPSILTLDNQEATIQVGSEVPVQSGTTVSTGGTTSFDVSREDIGVILKITPQISESNTVRLNLDQEISDVVPGSDPLNPTLTKRAVKTVVVASDKQTIVIGGLIDDSTTVATSKIPLVGDIPVLGSLFRNRTTTKAKQNIIVFITPYIIKERADYLAILKKKIEERNLFIELNYAPNQRKLIRESIRNHADALLEYKPEVQEVAQTTTVETSKPLDDAAIKASPQVTPKEVTTSTTTTSTTTTTPKAESLEPSTHTQQTESTSTEVKQESKSAEPSPSSGEQRIRYRQRSR